MLALRACSASYSSTRAYSKALDSKGLTVSPRDSVRGAEAGFVKINKHACRCPTPTPAQDGRPSSIAYSLLASAASSPFLLRT